ncbi:hypothetical protein MATL_G00136440 [Megalops atlanticus]|uniref:Uncharacterized protein n=1 Tax=Megalops atlanticus TaxID=7932 RepID=A0A9D3PYL9_MEGAT|nr:hypothetical protein MATL_G00136440 [Megalops atlanticus]
MIVKTLKGIDRPPHMHHQHHTHSSPSFHLRHQYSPILTTCHITVLNLKAFCKRCKTMIQMKACEKLCFFNFLYINNIYFFTGIFILYVDCCLFFKFSFVVTLLHCCFVYCMNTRLYLFYCCKGNKSNVDIAVLKNSCNTGWNVYSNMQDAILYTL